MKAKGLRRSILAMLVVFAMVFTYVPAVNTNIQTADAASTIKSNYMDESGYLFSLYDDGTAMASGYQGDDLPEELVIPSTCVQKGENGNPDVEYKVTAAAISFFRFADGTNNTTQAKTLIKSIILPEGVTKFSGTTGFSELENVSLPESLTTIQGGTLGNCPKLKALHIPKNVETIGTDICTSAKDMKISVAEGNEHFKVIDGALYTADMTRLILCETRDSIVVAETVTTIDYPVFSNRGGIKHVTLPSKMTELGTQPFLNCADLETVVLPEAITTIPGNCFQNCEKLKSIELPEGVTTIPGRAFSGCTSLEEIIIPSTCTDFTTNGQSHFWGCTSLKSLIIPDGTTYVPRRMIQNCTGLEFAVFPASITSAHNQAFQGISTDTIFIVEPGSTVEGLLKAAGATEFAEFKDPAIKTETLAGGVIGTEYSQELETAGYPLPELSVVAGELPAGLTLNADGTVAGTPEAVGEYKFTVKGYNGKTVTKEFTIAIEKVDITNFTVTDIEDVTYTGTAIKPAVTVTDADGKVLTAGTDYEVAYANNTEVGKAVVTITGIGNYEGEITKEFNITAPVDPEEPADVEYAIDIDGDNIAITDDMKEVGLDTEEAVVEYMYSLVTEEFGYDASTENTVVWDVKLMIRLDEDGSWVEATKENFPEDGITILLPYPEGTNGEDYDFEVIHMFSTAMNGFEAGGYEIPYVTETEDGLIVTVYGLSPFAITWQETTADVPVDTDSQDNNDVDVDTETETDTDDVIEPVDGSVQTGDESNMASMFALMIAALLTAGAVMVRRKEN